jgi:hypothetical protein
LVALPKQAGLDALSHLLGQLQAGQSALRRECRGTADKVDEMADRMSDLYGEVRVIREGMAAQRATESRRPATKPKSTKPWELPIGELFAQIGIGALKVVGVAAGVAILVWAVANAKIPSP